MKSILHRLFGKPTYFYNPRVEKGEGEFALYSVTIYKYWRRKSTPIITYADSKATKVLSAVHTYLEYMK